MTRGTLLSSPLLRGNKTVPIPAPQYFNCPLSSPTVIALFPPPPRLHPFPAQFTARRVAITLAMFLSNLHCSNYCLVKKVRNKSVRNHAE